MPDILMPLKWTVRQVAVLRALAEADAPLYSAQICERTGVDNQYVLITLKRLRDWRLIAEVNVPDACPHTRRRRYYKVTDRGRREAIKRCGDVPRET